MEKELPQEAGSLPKCRVLPWLDGSSRCAPSSLQLGAGLLHLHPIPRLRRGSSDLSAWLGGRPGPRCELNKRPLWSLLFQPNMPGLLGSSWCAEVLAPSHPAPSGLLPQPHLRESCPCVTRSSASQAEVYKNSQLFPVCPGLRTAA